MSAHCRLSSSVASAGDIGGTFVGGAPSSLVAGGSLLSIVSDHFLSPVTGIGFLSAISSCSLSFFAGGGLLSTVSGRLLSLVAGGGPSSTILVGGPWSFVLCVLC